MSGAIGLSIELILLATLGVTAVGMIVTANYSGFGSTTTLLFQTVVPIVVAVGFIILILKKAGYTVEI